MDAALDAKLRDLFTEVQPLGPWFHDDVPPDVSDKILYDNVSPFQEVAPHQRYLVLLGRKGSGKSAMLAELRSAIVHSRKSDKSSPRSLGPTLPDDGGSIVVSVESWKHFHSLVSIVAGRSQVSGALAELVPPEFYISVWHEILWDELFKHLFEYASSGAGYADLANVRKYINAETTLASSAEEAARNLFSQAKAEVLRLLTRRKLSLYYLFDSMDRYPIRNPLFGKVLAGFFQALVKINNESARLQVYFCLPEEIDRYVTKLSGAVLKGFGSSFRIRWKPIDLLRIVAHRYRVLAYVHDQKWHAQLLRLDLDRREDIHAFFSEVLPAKVTNRLKIDEDPLAYVIRHTQLLPRHAIVYFNAVISRSWEDTGGFREISEDALREGVNHVQRLVAQEILSPYELHFPEVIQRCSEILPDLSPICTYAELKRNEGRFARRIEEDATDLWRLLFDMGIIGRVLPQADAGELPHLPERYCYGAFHFNSQTDFGLATDAEYCFHPAFSGAFGMHRRNGDTRMVYPANIDMPTLRKA
jgi:hypothetical protein